MQLVPDLTVKTMDGLNIGELFVADIGGRSAKGIAGHLNDQGRSVILLGSDLSGRHPVGLTLDNGQFQNEQMVALGTNWLMEPLDFADCFGLTSDVGHLSHANGVPVMKVASPERTGARTWYNLISMQTIPVHDAGLPLFGRWRVWAQHADRNLPGRVPFFEFPAPDRT